MSRFLYVPARAKITDKVCIISETFMGAKRALTDKNPMYVTFNSKVKDPPKATIAIVDNLFTGPFNITKIYQPKGSDFYAELHIKNALSSNILDITLCAGIRYWSLNEIFMEGIVNKGGKIADGVEFVAVTYSGHSTLIIKDGDLYNKILSM